MISILEQLDVFMRSDNNRAWIGDPSVLSIYVRKSRRLIDQKLVDAIDVANIATINPAFEGKGVFKSFMIKVESYNLPVYVESIHNPELIAKLSKHGYQIIPSSYDTHMIKYPH